MSVQENPKELGLGEVLTGISGLALLGVLFLPWFNWIAGGIVISDGSGSQNPQNSLTLWETFPLIAYVLLALGIVAVGVVLFKFLRPTGFPSVINILLIGFGAIAAGIILLKIIMPPTEVDMGAMVLMSVDVTAGIGSFLALIATIGFVLGSGISLREHSRATTS